jgi:4-hydroxy-2-oxoheptanedioate aldolase
VYGVDLQKYVLQANDNIMVILMAEHIDFVNNCDQILSQVGGIDAISIGPADLAASMGLLGQSSNPKVLQAISKIEECANASNVPLGRSVANRTVAASYLNKGYRFFTGPSDFESIITAARTWMQGPI